MPNRVNETPAGTTRKADAMEGSEELVGVFRTLADEHDQVAALFHQLQQTPESSALLWPQIRRELVSHEHAEVRELYPLLRQFDETRDLADHHDQEAAELDALITRLDSMNVGTDEWIQLFDELVETVTQHAKEEEEAKIFPTAQSVIGEARAVELEAKLLATKQKLMETH
jgi:hemerythrin superfamily protein